MRCAKWADCCREFITAQTGDKIVARHQFLQPFGDLNQELIACAVAVGIVEFLEVVEVDEQQGDHVGSIMPARQLLLHLLDQPLAVGQMCQRIVERQLVDLLDQLMLLGDVGGDAAQTVDGVVRCKKRDFRRR